MTTSKKTGKIVYVFERGVLSNELNPEITGLTENTHAKYVYMCHIQNTFVYITGEKIE